MRQLLAIILLASVALAADTTPTPKKHRDWFKLDPRMEQMRERANSPEQKVKMEAGKKRLHERLEALRAEHKDDPKWKAVAKKWADEKPLREKKRADRKAEREKRHADAQAKRAADAAKGPAKPTK